MIALVVYRLACWCIKERVMSNGICERMKRAAGCWLQVTPVLLFCSKELSLLYLVVRERHDFFQNLRFEVFTAMRIWRMVL